MAMDDAQYFPKGTRKMTTTGLAVKLMTERRLMNTKGYYYEYTGKHWEQIDKDRLLAYSIEVDHPRYASTRRRNEVANVVASATYKDKIPWRQIGAHELPVGNGVIDLNTGYIRGHNHTDYLEWRIPVEYHPAAKCPTWLKALETYFGNDLPEDKEAKIQALQEYFGYVLMSHAKFKKALLLFGESNTGKSVVLHLLRSLLGIENCCAISVENMNDPRKLAPIVGKMLNQLTELSADAVIKDGGFKTLISTEEPVQIDAKYKDSMIYQPIAKHVVVTNTLPVVDDHTAATYNRMLIIKFNRELKPEEQDANMPNKLADEVKGVLAWAVEGAKRLHANKGEFTNITESDMILAEYRQDQNEMYDFIADACTTLVDADGGPAGFTVLKDFLEQFRKWSRGRYDRVPNGRLIGMIRGAGLTFGIDEHPESGKRVRVVKGIFVNKIADQHDYSKAPGEGEEEAYYKILATKLYPEDKLLG